MEPKVELCIELAVGVEDVIEGKASGGPRVRGEDTGDCGETSPILDAEVVFDGEVEWGGPPDGAPMPGEGGCPHGRLGGEEGDDDVKHLVG